jgi:hypothetical protein
LPPSLSSVKETKRPLRIALIKLFEGVSIQPSIYLIKFPGKTINYRAHAHPAPNFEFWGRFMQDKNRATNINNQKDEIKESA